MGLRSRAEHLYAQMVEWDRTTQLFFTIGLITAVFALMLGILEQQLVWGGIAMAWLVLIGLLAYFN